MKLSQTILKEGTFSSFPLTAIANFGCAGAVYCIKTKPAGAILICVWDIRGTEYNIELFQSENTDLALYSVKKCLWHLDSLNLHVYHL